MKNILLSICTLTATLSFSADNLESAFKEGKFDGQLRAFYTQRNYDYTTNSSDFKRDATTLGGKFGFETAALYGISVGARFYTANKVDNQIGSSATAKQNDQTVLNSLGESFSVLGEAYMKVSLGATTLKLGRQEISTPLLGTNDFRTTPNTYEALILTNKSLPDTTITAMQVWSQNAGTFSNAAGKNTNLAALYGFGRGYDVGKFVSLDTVMLGTTANTKGTEGLSALGIVYAPSSTFKAQVWDYYFHDILNSIYAQVDLSAKLGGLTPYISGQYIRQKDVGNNLLATTQNKLNVNSQLYGIKIGAKYKSTELSLTRQKTSVDTNAVYGGGIISLNSADGFITGMVTIHGNLANTTSDRISIAQGLKELFGHDFSFVANYMHYDIGKNNGYSDANAWKTREYQADFIYKPNAKSDIRFRYAKVKNFAIGLEDITDMRLIGNYNF